MPKWDMTSTVGLGGRFQIIITKLGHVNQFGQREGIPTDVTFFRGVPTQLMSYSSGDPFGDSTAQLQFPNITGFDDFNSQEIGSWLAEYSNVDIWWVPGILATTSGYPALPDPDAQLYEDPLTNRLDTISPVNNYSGSVITGTRRGTKVFEGYIASMALNGSDNGNSLTISCQGALFQADRYLEKPFYPANPQTLESLIAGVFDNTTRPHLRTHPLVIEWPIGWTQVAPSFIGTTNIYTPNVTPGQKWTGYTTRQTGSWDRSLTSFVQNNISVMLTQPESGVTPGNQWTVMLAHQGDSTYPVGRTPVLRVRDRFRSPDFSYWAGTPGIQIDMTKDSTQSSNILYGDGTDVAGTVWRNAIISHDGSRTDYAPLSAAPDVYPAINNDFFNPAVFASESYVKYGTGFNQPDAVKSANETLKREEDAGWSGTITVATDPATDMTRWEIRAGMTMLLKGFQGTLDTGMKFHVSAVEADPMSGTVQLTVDTRFRDLLSIEEALARSRDPLTPSKLLQLNKASGVIEDILAPWDYSAGSGYVPLSSKPLYDYAPAQLAFPYQSWVQNHPPFTAQNYYVQCNADSPDSRERWAGPIPILTAERGTIARTEFFMVDLFGIPVLKPFHVSLYFNNVTVTAMPMENGIYSPFIFGAFQKLNPVTGEPWSLGVLLSPDDSYIIGWGNYAQPAGFSPGLYTTGAQPTGLLEDDSTWTFDNTQFGQKFDVQLPVGSNPSSAITIYAMFYCEHTEPVYFSGRLYKQPQGV